MTVSQVCTKFLALSRDEQLWRLVSVRLWPQCSDGADLTYFGGSWLSMVRTRPHLLFHGMPACPGQCANAPLPSPGCYIGSTSYVRKGEPTFNTVSTPFLLVRYFRVLRFRSDGSVVMVTSAQDAQDIVRLIGAIDQSRDTGKLAPPNMNYSVASGHYSLVDRMVTCVCALATVLLIVVVKVFIHLVRFTDAALVGSCKLGGGGGGGRVRKVVLDECDRQQRLDMVGGAVCVCVCHGPVHPGAPAEDLPPVAAPRSALEGLLSRQQRLSDALRHAGRQVPAARLLQGQGLQLAAANGSFVMCRRLSGLVCLPWQLSAFCVCGCGVCVGTSRGHRHSLITMAT